MFIASYERLIVGITVLFSSSDFYCDLSSQNDYSVECFDLLTQ